MNITKSNLLNTISTTELKKITTVVDETLAVILNSHKTFTAADMWNIQRRRKSFSQRRFNA